MRRVAFSRERHVDLLRGPPVLNAAPADPTAHRAVHRLDQVRALLHLVDRGVLSPGEFETQESKVFRRP